jgi:hypothetical protein
MKVWTFVEGPPDRLALEALFDSCGWSKKLRSAGHGIHVIDLGNKTKLLRTIGTRAARYLAANTKDLAIGLPDLYPFREYDNTEYQHHDVSELGLLQARMVERSLRDTFRIKDDSAVQNRFLGAAFRHDLEVLLLAAEQHLSSYLSATSNLGQWRKMVEDQNDTDPPKRVIERVFRTKHPRRIAYQDTHRAPAVLRRVSTLGELIFLPSGQVRCPIFKTVIDWIAARTGVDPYAP